MSGKKARNFLWSGLKVPLVVNHNKSESLFFFLCLDRVASLDAHALITQVRYAFEILFIISPSPYAVHVCILLRN